MDRVLPPDIVALVHHVELHGSGWWISAVTRMIAHILLSDRDLSGASIEKSLRETFDARLTPADIDEALAVMTAAGQVVMTEQDRYALTTTAQSLFEQEIAEWGVLEMEAAEAFADLLDAHGITGDPIELWQDFRDTCLMPLIRTEGAQVLRFVTPTDVTTIMQSQLVSDYVSASSVEVPEELATVVLEFISSPESVVRTFVLRNLDSYFLVAATALDSETAQRLRSPLNEETTLRVVLDSNIVFSMLGLSDSYSSNAVKSMLGVCSHCVDGLKVEFVVVEDTLVETQFAIRNKAERLSDIRWSGKLADAALEIGVPGLVEQYLFEYKRSGGVLPFSEFAELLERDIERKLVDLGVVIEEDTAGYGTRQDVVDDINDQLSFQEKRVPAGKRRRYEQVRHDMVLYHWTADRRNARESNPVEVGYWLVTLDTRLLGFDLYKAKGSPHGSICIHPAAFLQMIQLWIPRSEQVEAALFDTIRLPLMSSAALAETEDVTYRILRRLGTLAGIESISEDAIRTTLRDEAVRAGFREATSEAEEIQVIEEEFVRLLETKESELMKVEYERGVLDERLAKKTEEAAGKTAELADVMQSLSTAEEALKTLSSRQTVLIDDGKGKDGQIDDLTDQLESERGKNKSLRVALQAVVGAVVLALLVILAGNALLGTQVLEAFKWATPQVVWVSLAATATGIWIFFTLEGASHLEECRDNPWFGFVATPARRLLFAGASVGLVVIAAMITKATGLT